MHAQSAHQLTPQSFHLSRRRALQALAASIAGTTFPRLVQANPGGTHAVIGAAWRGPRERDPNFAGTLVADWEARKLAFGYAVPLPSRPHGLMAEPGGGLLVCSARPGTWMLRCDAQGKAVQQIDVQEEGMCRLGGHVIASADGERLYTTETDFRSGKGRIGVRDRRNLRKLAEWDTHGLDPHQLLLDAQGHLFVANGGIPRTLSDKKVDLHRMDASLVRIDTANGALLGHWRVDDPRLSLRHMAWSRPPQDGDALLGIAMQAEHDLEADRRRAPILAVFDGDHLSIPTQENDGIGYAGDIAPALHDGFALSSHQADVTNLWHPGLPERMRPIVQLKASYALTGWHGPQDGGGVLVATAYGLGRWHPSAPANLLAWPEPMALDNHWILIEEA
ncbi:Twin-arginine translocation pathway signal [Thauera humireducens]|uniref:DUF1513 domain-containing protein n=1 Tax=Thauera humireducens TaxID=1134435 RepID=UPI002467A2A1|nr:DUF1513 domain-containing protein [Thauera humireducens]CAH1747054.1 Twin-arginine translocation pathway signal [Thauera humireducens]